MKRLVLTLTPTLLITLVATTVVRANVVGFTQVNSTAPSSTAGITGGTTSLQLTDVAAFGGSTPPIGGPLPAETSATWNFGSPKQIQTVLVFPNIGLNNQPYRYQILTNGGATAVIDDTWTTEGTTDLSFRPRITHVNLESVNSLKYKTVNITRVNAGGFDQIRDISGMVALQDKIGDLVSPNLVTSSVPFKVTNPITNTIDNVRSANDNSNLAITSIVSTVASADVTYTFTTPTWLMGLMVNTNWFDSPAPFAWQTWDVFLPNGTMIVDKTGTDDRFQLLKFDKPRLITSFILRGPMNPDTLSNGRGRLGEVWGITAVPEPAGLTLVGLGAMALVRRRRRQ